MLIARPSRRCVQRLGRSFASVVDNSGVKVAAVESNQPTSSITFLVKAGSRFEPKPGVAHALKNFAFKSTASRSALGTIRESELYGGILSSTLSREYLAVTAEFLRGDEEFFVDVLSSWIKSGQYARHELNELVWPTMENEIQTASNDPSAVALEAAHGLAFRAGLGSSLFASPHPSFTVEDIKSFASSAFTKDKLAVLATGIPQETLSELVTKYLGNLADSSATTSTSASSYYGGETRLPGQGGLETVFIGFGAAGAPTPEINVLAAHLSPEPAVKWSKGTSPLAQALPDGASVQSVYLPYSDACLFGLLVQGATPALVTEAGKAAVSVLKGAVASSGGLKGDDLKKAVAKAKFSTAHAVDTRQGLISFLGPKTLDSPASTLDATLTALDKVTATSFSKTAGAFIKAKPTFVAVGSTSSLPHVDELGL